jgi:hypothetical protein
MKQLNGIYRLIPLFLISLLVIGWHASNPSLTAELFPPRPATTLAFSSSDPHGAVDDDAITRANSTYYSYLPSIHAADPNAGTVYYVSPTGDDSRSGLSATNAWATFDRAWQSIQRGDTLILLDGVYYQRLIPQVPSGTEYITIKAQNEGQAIIDGQFASRTAVEFRGWNNAHYIQVEGIVAKNTLNAVWEIQTDNNIFRRISGYNAGLDNNSTVIWLSGNNNILEDCVAAGSGRKMILTMGFGTQVEKRNIVRRCFSGWQEWRGGDFCPGHIPWGNGIDVYNASFNIVENSIGYGLANRPGGGINVFAQSSSDADHNSVLGSITMNAAMKWDGTDMTWPCPYPGSSCSTCWNPEGGDHGSGLRLGMNTRGSVSNNLFQDVFSYGNAGLGLARMNPRDDGTIVNNNRLIRATLINNGIGSYVRNAACDSPFDTRCVKDRNFQLSILDRLNVFEDNKIECTEAQAPYCIDSGFNGSGARIEYRYNSYFDANGNPVIVLTDEPLWPWPMEDRIRQEFNTHLSMYHTQTPELVDFSVTNTITPILAQYGALDAPVLVLPSYALSTIISSTPVLLSCELDVPRDIFYVITMAQSSRPERLQNSSISSP